MMWTRPSKGGENNSEVRRSAGEKRRKKGAQGDTKMMATRKIRSLQKLNGRWRKVKKKVKKPV